MPLIQQPAGPLPIQPLAGNQQGDTRRVGNQRAGRNRPRGLLQGKLNGLGPPSDPQGQSEAGDQG